MIEARRHCERAQTKRKCTHERWERGNESNSPGVSSTSAGWTTHACTHTHTHTLMGTREAGERDRRGGLRLPLGGRDKQRTQLVVVSRVLVPRIAWMDKWARFRRVEAHVKEGVVARELELAVGRSSARHGLVDGAAIRGHTHHPIDETGAERKAQALGAGGAPCAAPLTSTPGSCVNVLTLGRARAAGELPVTPVCRSLSVLCVPRATWFGQNHETL